VQDTKSSKKEIVYLSSQIVVGSEKRPCYQSIWRR